jgi:hypothetical protein
MSDGVGNPVLSPVVALTGAVDDAMSVIAMKTTALETQIEEEAEKLQALVRQRNGLDRQIEAARTRLEAFQQALALVTGQPVVAESFVQDGAIITPRGRVRPTLNHADPWEDALIVMKKRGGEFSTDQIITEAEARGADLTRDRARSRLAHLVERRILERVRDGNFKFLKDTAA